MTCNTWRHKFTVQSCWIHSLIAILHSQNSNLVRMKFSTADIGVDLFSLSKVTVGERALA